jgi:hypothetical protein
MKIRPLVSIICLLSSLLFFLGCSSTATSTAAPKGTIALRIGTSTAATIALARNPAYVPMAIGLAAGIDAALTGQLTITPEAITGFVAKIAAQNHVPPADVALWTNLALNIYRAYLDDFHPTGPILISDPNVRAYVEAFKNGLTDATSGVVPSSS